MKTRIQNVIGRRVWDSRGRPTIEVDVRLEGGATGRAIAPAGASTGSAEAVDKRDGGEAFGGLDVMDGVNAVNGDIKRALQGLDASDQQMIDRTLITLDGTPNKSRLGGNALIATSMANRAVTWPKVQWLRTSRSKSSTSGSGKCSSSWFADA